MANPASPPLSSRLPRSLLTAHSAAADVGFVGVWGLPLGGNSGKRFTMAVLLFLPLKAANGCLVANPASPPLRSPVRASRAHS